MGNRSSLYNLQGGPPRRSDIPVPLLFSAVYRGKITPFITGRGAHLVSNTYCFHYSDQGSQIDQLPRVPKLQSWRLLPSGGFFLSRTNGGDDATCFLNSIIGIKRSFFSFDKNNQQNRSKLPVMEILSDRWFNPWPFDSPIVGGHRQPLSSGHVNSPSKNGHQQNCQVFSKLCGAGVLFERISCQRISLGGCHPKPGGWTPAGFDI